MLGGGKPNQYLDRKNLEKHDVLPDQRAGVAGFPQVVGRRLQANEAPATG